MPVVKCGLTASMKRLVDLGIARSYGRIDAYEKYPKILDERAEPLA